MGARVDPRFGVKEIDQQILELEALAVYAFLTPTDFRLGPAAWKRWRLLSESARTIIEFRMHATVERGIGLGSEEILVDVAGRTGGFSHARLEELAVQAIDRWNIRLS